MLWGGALPLVLLLLLHRRPGRPGPRVCVPPRVAQRCMRPSRARHWDLSRLRQQLRSHRSHGHPATHTAYQCGARGRITYAAAYPLPHVRPFPLCGAAAGFQWPGYSRRAPGYSRRRCCRHTGPQRAPRLPARCPSTPGPPCGRRLRGRQPDAGMRASPVRRAAGVRRRAACPAGAACRIVCGRPAGGRPGACRPAVAGLGFEQHLTLSPKLVQRGAPLAAARLAAHLAWGVWGSLPATSSSFVLVPAARAWALLINRHIYTRMMTNTEPLRFLFARRLPQRCTLQPGPHTERTLLPAPTLGAAPRPRGPHPPLPPPRAGAASPPGAWLLPLPGCCLRRALNPSGDWLAAGGRRPRAPLPRPCPPSLRRGQDARRFRPGASGRPPAQLALRLGLRHTRPLCTHCLLCCTPLAMAQAYCPGHPAGSCARHTAASSLPARAARDLGCWPPHSRAARALGAAAPA